MTTAVKLISRLGAAGIQLWLDEQQQLRFRAPKGAMTDELKAAVIASKADIIAFLQQSHSHADSIPQVPREPGSLHDLSFSQQRFWFLDKLQPGNPSLHIPAVLLIEGVLDIAALQQAFQQLSQRHEILRTVFISTDQHETKQQILPQLHYDVQLNADLSPLDKQTQQQQLAQRIHDEALQAFTLESSPQQPARLLRISLIRLAEKQHYLLLTLHHIIADGWSVQLLINELSQLYQAAVTQQPPLLPALPVQYVDYSHWQQQQLQSGLLQQQLQYWQQQLQDVPVLDLPTDFPRPQLMQAAGASCQQTLDNQLVQRVHQLAAQWHSSAFSIFLSAFAALLYRYTGQTDICIGTPVAGRNRQELEPMIGCLINLLAIRNPVDGTQSFSALASQVSQTLLQAQENQAIPFETVAEHCISQRDTSHTPVFQVLITHQHQLPRQFHTAGLDIQLQEQPSLTAKYDLQLHIDEQAQHSTVVIEFNTALFRTETIQRFLQHFTALLTAACQSPENTIGQLAFISPAEQQQLDEWNRTEHAYSPCNALHLLIEAQVLRTPDAIAVQDEQRTLRYTELNHQANQLAHYLLAHHVQPGQPVGVCLYRSVDISIALLAILKAGAAYVPFDPDFPAERLHFMADDTAVPLVISHSNISTDWLPDTIHCLLMDQPQHWQTMPTENPASGGHDQQCFNIIYTSGSTGQPKGVMVPQRGIINRLRWMQHQYAIDNSDTVLQKTPYSFDVSVWELFWPLMQGSALIYARPEGHKDPAYLRDMIIRHNITTVHFVPSMLGVFLQTEGIEQCTSLRQVFCSGEALQRDHCRVFYQRLPQAALHNLYGPTEASVDVSFYPCVADEPNRSVPIGKPIHNTQLYILDNSLNPVPPGIIGDLYIGGVGLANGYLNREELTASVFIDNPFNAGSKLYRSGDVARFLADGNIEYLGRSDHQIKIRGLRIELGEIETRLQQLPAVREAIVGTWSPDNQPENQQLVAWLLSSSDIDKPQLRKLLAQQLPAYMIPAHFMRLDAWPLSHNGKINRKALPMPEPASQQQDYCAPQTALQQQLCTLWQNILGIQTIGIHDNFFELGGHSLNATRLVAAINQQCDSQLPLVRFFETPTIAELADFIEQQTTIDNSNSVIPLADRSQPIPLSPAQQRLWIIDQFNPGNIAYNIPLALKLDGPLNTDALKNAIQRIIERHESLRTRVSTDAEGNALQQILPAEDFVIEEQMLAADDNSEHSLQQHFNAFAQQPFNLLEDWLIRVCLLQQAPQSHVLMVCMHHIIADGWSLNVLQNELATLYQTERLQQAPALPALTRQYADFSVWQQQYLQQAQQQHHMDYWLQQLDDIPPCIQLPLDRPRPAQQTFNGKMYSCLLPQNISQQLQLVSQQQHVSLFTTLLSIYSLLLHKYARQQDICIGTPVSGREQAGLQSLIGYFVNAVVIRSRFSGNPTLGALLQQTHQTALEAFAHQDIPVEQILEKLPLERNLSYPPVAQVGFSFINRDLASLPTLDQISVSTLAFEQVVAKYELSLIVIEQHDGLQLNVEYNSDLFDESTIATLLQHFTDLAGRFANAAEQPVSAMSLLSVEDIARLSGYKAQQIEAVYPLTAMQQDMVMSQWMNPDSLANTLGYRAELNTWVDDQLWQQACQQTCNAEPVTRTVFCINPLNYDEFAWQCVLKPLPVTLNVMDYRHELLDETAIDQRVADFIYQPRAYSAQQFIRYGLMRISDQRTILLLSSHHALLDGVSIVLIAQQAARHFEALNNQQIQANDWQSGQILADYLQQDKQQRDSTAVQQFWQQAFRHCEALDFPADACSKQSQQQVKTLMLAPELTQQLKHYCRQHRMTIAQLLKLVYGYLVSQYCRAESDFYFSEFQAGRNRANATALGCFFEQTPFIFPASQLTAQSRIQDLFDHLRRFRKEIKAFDAISLGMTRKLAPAGRIHFMYNYYHFFPQQQTMLGHDITCIEMPPFIEQTVQFIAKEQEHSISLDLYYQSQVFADLQFLPRLQSLLQQLVNGTERLADLSLLLSGETATLSGRQSALPATVHTVQQWFEQQAEQTPQAIAVSDDHGELSYQQLNQRANQLAQLLRQQGAGRNISIGVCLPRSSEAIISILAIIKAGACYVPIDPAYPPQRIQHMLEQADIRLLVSNHDTAAQLPQHQATVLLTETLWPLCDDQPDSNLASINAIDDRLYIIFTSGSTGLPKAAMLSHKGELNLLQWYCREFDFSSDSHTLIISALGFDLTQKNLFAPLVSGGTLVLTEMPHYDADHIRKLIEQHEISHINCAPSAFYPLTENNPHQLRSLQYVILGGEAIQTALLTSWFNQPDCNARLVNNYGPTECTDIALFYTVDNPATLGDVRIPLGKPNDNVSVSIRNPFMQLLPTGLTGELCISGEGVGLGYLNNPEANAEKFITLDDGDSITYRSGDLARQQQDGNIGFIGRMDFQVKLNGLRIELGEIEHTLKQLADVSDALVLVHEQQLVAYLQTNSTPDTTAVQQQLSLSLPAYMLPTHYISLTQWPLTANGKIDRKALPLPDNSRRTSEYVAPRDDIEQAICDIVRRVLNLEQVGIYDNFFELGGHSLAASRAIVQIREHFGIDIPLNILFDMTTAEKLANYIRAAQWATQSAELPQNGEGRDTGFI